MTDKFAEHLPPLEQQMAQLMHGLSESCWYAGWMSGTEHVLWKFVVDGIPPRQSKRSRFTWGHCDQEEVQAVVDKLRDLAKATDRWIVWDDDLGEERSDPVRAVPLQEWRKLHERRPDGTRWTVGAIDDNSDRR